MRLFMVLVVGIYLSLVLAAQATSLTDVTKAPSCRQCGMDRDKFSHSRMVIEYEDGSTVGTCSLHCTAVELANTIDKIPVMVSVADYDTRKLIDSDRAIWVMGGSRKGVMTGQAKWAFAAREPAEQFIKAYGGTIVSFDQAIKAAYDDMYQDTKMIREFRKMKQNRMQDATNPR